MNQLKIFVLVLAMSIPFLSQGQQSRILGRSTSGWHSIKIDPATHVLEAIPYLTSKIHDGSGFFSNGWISIDSGDSTWLAIITPNTTTWSHLRFVYHSSDTLKTYVFESSTVEGGTLVTDFNYDRNSSDTSNVVIKKNPTISVAGTTIDSSYVLDDIPGTHTQMIPGVELILKQNTTYIFMAVSQGASNLVNWKASWIEHSNLE